MTNTIVVIPISQDPRPSEFNASFDTEAGVRVNVNIETRDKGVADAITAKVASLGWTPATTPGNMALWQIFLAVPFAAFMLWLFFMIGCVVLDVAGWLPHVTVDGYVLDSFNTMAFFTKHFIRWSLILWVPVAAIFMLVELGSRDNKA